MPSMLRVEANEHLVSCGHARLMNNVIGWGFPAPAVGIEKTLCLSQITSNIDVPPAYKKGLAH